MNFKKKDIKRIGYQAYHDQAKGKGKRLIITCSHETANVEFFFLRSILDLWGYQITEEKDYTWSIEGSDKETTDIDFVTDMPWSEYMAAFDRSE